MTAWHEDDELAVECCATDGGWTCRVRVGADPGATDHVVMLDRETLAGLAPPGTPPAELLVASFRFLLEREPRESIMRTFDLPIISRFFADYESEIGRRLRPQP